MKCTPQDIKASIAIELQKQGSSIEDFEVELSHGCTKTANALSAVVAALKSLGTIGAGTAAAGGLIGAGGIYGAYKGNQDSDDKINKKMQERQQYIDAMNSLQAAGQESQMSGMR